MRTRLTNPFRAWTAIASLLLLAVASTSAQIVDLNHNGMSDVWEWMYGGGNVDPNADPDGDGFVNRLEAIAGTNPFDSTSFPHITAISVSGTNVNVSMNCALGKLYQLQSCQALTNGVPTSWADEASIVARTGTVVTLTAPATVSSKFMRIAISDVDTDGDGVNDWEEYQLGLDPMNAYSNGQLDGNGQPMTDYDYVVGKLASENVVTITAPDPTATEPDPGQPAIWTGMYAVSRGGFPLNAITVHLALGGPGDGFAVEGLDHAVLPRSVVLPAGVSYQPILLTPLTDTNLMAPVVAQLNLLAAHGYSVGSNSNAAVVIYPSTTPNGGGLTGQYYTNSSLTYTSSANFNPANLKLTRLDPTIDFTWGTTTNPIPNNGYYCVRWTGQVEPQYSETYYFDAYTDDGVKVWVNDQLVVDNWTAHTGTDSIGTIALQGGVRYDIRMDYFQSTGSAQAHLYWYSPSQSRQIIPSNRLFPTTVSAAPTSVTSPLSAVGFLGQPFSFSVTGANLPLGYTASGLPPGLTLNPTNGLISGVPSLAGDYPLIVTSSNSLGLAASIVDIQILDTGSSVVREVWLGVPGTNVSDIPVNSPATLTNVIGTLEGITDYGDNYGERVRGFLTAPATGNYYFWIAGSDSAELWISNDGEPVNKVKRSSVLPSADSAPPINGTGPRQWSVQTNQQSGWLSLVAGQRYYIEVLHKAGVGTNDNWSVGWLQDPSGTNTVPSGVVPGYVLSRYYPLPIAPQSGTLYSATLAPEPGVVSTASGSATLRVSADGSQAVLKFNYSGLSSPLTGEHIHCDPYLNNPSQIMFDIDAATPQPDGSYVWNIAPVGTLQVADIAEIIKEGKAYLNIHSANYPNGEISGHFAPIAESPTFTPPPAPPAWTDDHTDPNAAARFLQQATYGPSSNDIATVQALGYDAWINTQFALPVTHHLPLVLANTNSDPTQPYPSSLTFNTWWLQSVTAPDQLRQRVAFALSEIMVVSENGVLANYYANCLSSYYDTLLDNAFGNYRTLLKNVSLTPAMGIYLDMRGNDKGSLLTGLHANENYGREIMQLFSIGLNRLWPDGTLVVNSQGSLVPTYDQNTVMGFAAAFTGWNYHQAYQTNGRLPSIWFPNADYVDPMILVPTHHDPGTKQLLDNVVLPAAQGSQADSTSTNYDNYGLHDLDAALDSIFYNQNVGPFVCRQLIQRLVTSNPSRAYVYRVTQVFNDNGSGVRGDMQAVIKAILLDYEARSSTMLSEPTFGKQREPVLRVTAPARAFPSPPPNGGTYSQTGGPTIAITSTNIHRLNNGDIVFLTFTDTSGQPAPPTQGYGVTVTSPSAFTVSAPNLATGTYAQTNNAITVALSGHGLAAGNLVLLTFTTGGASNGIYAVSTVIDSVHFNITAPDSVSRSGNCYFPKLSGGGYVVQGKTNVTVITSMMHGFNPGDSLWMNFNSAGSPESGQYQVATVPDSTHFTIVIAATNNQTENGLTIYPLVAPVLVRSGNVGVQQSTWNMGYTDTGTSTSLLQTPLRAPTVFNFFFPGYMFPGTLAASGLTTPEFQLTSDTGVALQMNFLEGSILNNGNNTNGLSSFINGGGAIVLDIGPWMTTNYTSNAGLPSLVDALNTLLCAGQLSVGAKTNIVNYATTLTSSNPNQQMRDRVRAAVHLILNSPDYTIQK